MSAEAFIGIDLGGTNVRAGVVTPAGELMITRDAPIRAREGAQAGIQRITGLIEQVSRQAGIRPAGIGIGSTGPLDRERGAIQNPYTLPTWEDVDIAGPLRSHFGVPVVLENDADAAALGESWAGAGRGLSRLLMVTVGTGIGTGFILDGHIFRGAGGVHPEGGHIPVDPAGPLCYCGAKGCWESLASGTAIGDLARAQAQTGPTRLLQMAGNDPARIDAALVVRAAQEGDELAGQVIERAATHLALGLVTALHLYIPDCVVFTGGVMRSFGMFEPTLKETLKRHSVMSPLDRTPLVLSALGQEAGVFGAARAAMLELAS